MECFFLNRGKDLFVCGMGTIMMDALPNITAGVGPSTTELVHLLGQLSNL